MGRTGLVLGSSVLIAAERRKLAVAQAIENIQRAIGEVPVVLSAVTIAEIGHRIDRANPPEIRQRRRAFLVDLKATVPIYPLTEPTAEIIARNGGEQAAKGTDLPSGDLRIGACAFELGYTSCTGNARDFSRIPDLPLISL